MPSKAEVLMNPVRMKIVQVLMRNKEAGLTPLEMVKIIEDVSQATLYRHIQVLLDADVIRIAKEQKVRGVSEKFYTLNENELRLDPDEWNKSSKEEKLNYISYYQLLLFSQYQSYLSEVEEKDTAEDRATFSFVELKLSDDTFTDFQKELNDLIYKYYQVTNDNHDMNIPTRTVGITIIPES